MESKRGDCWDLVVKFESLLATGAVLADWGNDYVVCLFKTGSRNKTRNYMP